VSFFYFFIFFDPMFITLYSTKILLLMAGGRPTLLILLHFVPTWRKACPASHGTPHSLRSLVAFGSASQPTVVPIAFHPRQKQYFCIEHSSKIMFSVAQLERCKGVTVGAPTRKRIIPTSSSAKHIIMRRVSRLPA
jgi:hypothetical protein